MKPIGQKKLSVLRGVSCLALALSCAQAPVLAAQLLFSPDGSPDGGGAIDTALPLSKVGSVTVPRGTFIIHGDRAQITTVPEWQFDSRAVLTGRVLDTRKSALTPSTREITGVIFFDGGEWLSYFSDPAAIETVITDKASLSGRITAVSNLDIELSQVNEEKIGIPLSNVKDISSPRAFRFNIPITGNTGTVDFTQRLELDARRVSLLQLGRPFKLAQLKTLVRRESADGDLSTKKLVALGTGVSLLNMAQLAPLLGISLGVEPVLRNRAFFKNYVFNATSINTAPALPAP